MSELENAVKAVETEAAKVETEAKAEVAKVEPEVEKVATEVKSEAEKVEAAVVGAAEKAKAAVVKYATEARIAISAEENLFVTKMENAFLKGQMEIRRLQDEAKAIQSQYPQYVESLTKKYLINPATHVFNAIEGAFTKK